MNWNMQTYINNTGAPTDLEILGGGGQDPM